MRFQYAADYSVEVDEFDRAGVFTPGWWAGEGSAAAHAEVVEPSEHEPATNGVRVRVTIGKLKVVMSLQQADEIRKACDMYAQHCQHAHELEQS